MRAKTPALQAQPRASYPEPCIKQDQEERRGTVETFQSTAQLCIFRTMRISSFWNTGAARSEA
jgi:hypothetical protein